MNLYVRLLRVLLGGWFQAGADYADTTTGRFRVWLHDLDAFGHMNNGRYLQIMDFARTHLIASIHRSQGPSRCCRYYTGCSSQER